MESESQRGKRLTARRILLFLLLCWLYTAFWDRTFQDASEFLTISLLPVVVALMGIDAHYHANRTASYADAGLLQRPGEPGGGGGRERSDWRGRPIGRGGRPDRQREHQDGWGRPDYADPRGPEPTEGSHGDGPRGPERNRE